MKFKSKMSNNKSEAAEVPNDDELEQNLDDFQNAPEPAKKGRAKRWALIGGAIGLLVVAVIAVVMGLTTKRQDNAGVVDVNAEIEAAENLAVAAPMPPRMYQPVSDPDEGRYLGHILTDKPFYKPKEVVFIEAWVVDSLNKTPKFMPQPQEQSSEHPKRYVYTPKLQATVTILDSFETAVFTSPPREL